MTSITMRILKDNEIVYADLDVNTKGVGVKDESNEEEEDSEQSVVDVSDDFNTKWKKIQKYCK